MGGKLITYVPSPVFYVEAFIVASHKLRSYTLVLHPLVRYTFSSEWFTLLKGFVRVNNSVSLSTLQAIELDGKI